MGGTVRWVAAYAVGMAHTYSDGATFRGELLAVPGLDAAVVEQARDAVAGLDRLTSETRRIAIDLLEDVLGHLHGRILPVAS